MKNIIISISLALVLIFVIGCSEIAPKRNHIADIKNRLFRLQEAVKDHNLAAIDSLLSPKILAKDQSSDSLVRAVFGLYDDFGFTQFGGAQIIYTHSDGRIDCFIMDSTTQRNRPLVFYLTYDHDIWLVSSFSVGEPIIQQDSQ